MSDRKRGKYVSKMQLVSMGNEAIFFFFRWFTNSAQLLERKTTNTTVATNTTVGERHYTKTV